MGGRDFSEIHRTGGNVIDYIEHATANMPQGFRPALGRLRGESARRLEEAKHILGFGVNYLDKALGGIARNDLVIIGARTGAGKTELSTLIAMYNAAQGRVVHYLALEAEEDEIERRLKYKTLVQLVAENCTGAARRRMNYLDWRYGRLEDITGPFEGSAQAILETRVATLYTRYREGDFNAEKLAAVIEDVKDATDLVVIDHLHYVDTDDANENRGYKHIVKTIRDVALRIGRPVVVVAHIRKGDRRAGALVPDCDEFHGTSDVPKISTKAITLAPASDQPHDKPSFSNTYMRAAKCRPDGERTRYCGLVGYNHKFGVYEETFSLGRLMNADTHFEPLENEKYPPWAEHKPSEVQR